MLLEQREEISAADREALRVLQRERRGGKVPAFVDGHRAKRVAPPKDFQDDLLAARSRLEDLDAALDDGQERVGRLAFAKDQLAAGKSFQPSDLQDVLTVVEADAPEHVDLAEH